MDALVTAGGVPAPGESLYSYSRGEPKALIDICGKPMLQWVLDALEYASKVEKVIVVGLERRSDIFGSKVVSYLPNQGTMLQNLRAGMREARRLSPKNEHLLTVSSDIPGITAEMVDWVIQEAEKTDEDAYYNVITRQTMEKRYPASRRSYVKFRDVEVCGGDMNVIRSSIGEERDCLWEKIIEARKNALKQAALIGYDTLFLLLFRLITLEDAVKLVTSRLQITGRALVCPFAEVGMDVDKPSQLEMMRADLSQRQAGLSLR